MTAALMFHTGILILAFEGLTVVLLFILFFSTWLLLVAIASRFSCRNAFPNELRSRSSDSFELSVYRAHISEQQCALARERHRF